MKRLGIVVLGLALAGFAILLMARGLSNPVLRIRVVDGGGKPIGAVVTPDGIRGTDGGHYGWATERQGVKPERVKTGTDGRAEIPYPRFIIERVRSIEISFGVKHPDYCAERPFLKVANAGTSATPLLPRLQYMWEELRHEGERQVVTLKPGAALEVRGTVNGMPIRTDELRVEVVSMGGIFPWDSFRESEGRLVSHQSPPGNFMMRGIYQGKNGELQFSEVMRAAASLGATNSLTLEMKPGHRVRGKLAGVEDTVINGWVNARVVTDYSPGESEHLVWADFAEVNRDGTFLFTNLPAGRLEVTAICDGYLSQALKGTFVVPVSWPLEGDWEVTVPMRESATAEIRLADKEGHPAANVEVVFWPNIQWANTWSTIFASDFYRSSDAWKSGKPWKEQEGKRSFRAKTDPNGRAVVRELPPVTLPFSVADERFELPVEKNSDHESIIVLKGGRTNYVSLKLQPKGKQLRE